MILHSMAAVSDRFMVGQRVDLFPFCVHMSKDNHGRTFSSETCSLFDKNRRMKRTMEEECEKNDDDQRG
jgi:hypothetical protein